MWFSLLVSLSGWRLRAAPSIGGVDVGITALAPSSGELFLGTRGGDVLTVGWRTSEEHHVEKFDRSHAGLSLPVYSLALADGYLLAGGGHRYVDVWRRLTDGRWNLTQRLGLHTGWVKDVLWDADNQLLHSIGCNCIETWFMDGDTFRHRCKSAIESSPDLGATLSSDLLCLCPFGTDRLLSGGVDGRIHVWQSSIMKETRFSFAAHQGRVNDLVYDHVNALAFSASHDNTIKCWSIDGTGSSLVDEFNLEPRRVTAIELCPSPRGKCILVAGSSDGRVLLLGFEIETGFSVHCDVGMEDSPTVNAICALNNPNPVENHFTIVVGHSKGLATFSCLSPSIY